MRLSDAIALGRTIKRGSPGHMGTWSLDSPGCALGMAVAAIGDLNAVVTVRWPWVRRLVHALPCGCASRDGYADGVNGTIAHLFDGHVFGRQDWTLDQLIDWVRSVEPAEAVETPAEEKTIAESAPSLVAQG